MRQVSFPQSTHLWVVVVVVVPSGLVTTFFVVVRVHLDQDVIRQMRKLEQSLEICHLHGERCR